MAASKDKPTDAIDLLMADHREVEKLFKEFEKNKEDTAAIEDIVVTACTMLFVHSEIEKEIFYPEVLAKADKELKELLDEAEVEHEAVDNLVEKLSAVKLDDDNYKANFTVLAEFVKHHVKEEEEEMFPKVRKLKDLDLEELGMRMQAQKEALMDELAAENESDTEDAEAGGAMRQGKSKSKGQRASR
jgi:hemerythrin superfamily protein